MLPDKSQSFPADADFVFLSKCGDDVRLFAYTYLKGLIWSPTSLPEPHAVGQAALAVRGA